MNKDENLVETDVTNKTEEHKELPTTINVNDSLKEAAIRCSKDVEISSMLSESTVDNMKAFLLVYSRSQLNRVVQLTGALGALESKLISQATSDEYMDNYEIMDIIRTIQKSLDSAISLIKQVTSDESYLKVIINNTEVINNNLAISNNSFSILKDKDSRDRVRSAVSNILNKIGELEGK